MESLRKDNEGKREKLDLMRNERHKLEEHGLVLKETLCKLEEEEKRLYSLETQFANCNSRNWIDCFSDILKMIWMSLNLCSFAFFVVFCISELE